MLGVDVFSALVNPLTLTGPLFMLQVYDRAPASQSAPTLVALFGLAAGLYAFMGVFDFIRARMLGRVAHSLDVRARTPLFRTFVLRGLAADKPEYRPLSDWGSLRGWLSSPGPLALFDLPWFPFYLAIVALMHPWLGLPACAGAGLVTLVALANQWAVPPALRCGLGRDGRGALRRSGRAQRRSRGGDGHAGPCGAALGRPARRRLRCGPAGGERAPRRSPPFPNRSGWRCNRPSWVWAPVSPSRGRSARA
jgi:hypothetical protein